MASGTSETLEQNFIEIPKPALITSLIIHGSIALFFLTLKVLDHFGIHPFSKANSRTERVQGFIQVDVIGLPDTLWNNRKDVDSRLPIVDNPKPIRESKSEVSAKEDMEVPTDKSKPDKKRANEQEKALRKLEEEARREQALKSLTQGKLAKAGKEGRAKIAGNITSQGTGATGAIGNAKDQYSSLVYQAIKQHFSFFPWHAKKGLVSVVYIEIFPTGRLRQKKILKHSKDPLFDSAVLQAIDEAQPLPTPEEKSLMSEGITVEFRPEE